MKVILMMLLLLKKLQIIVGDRLYKISNYKQKSSRKINLELFLYAYYKIYIKSKNVYAIED